MMYTINLSPCKQEILPDDVFARKIADINSWWTMSCDANGFQYVPIWLFPCLGCAT